MLTILVLAPAAETAGDADEVVAESSPPNVWYRNRLSVVIPLEVERIEAKQRVVSAKCEHAAFYMRGESALASSITVGRAEVGEDNSMNRDEVKLEITLPTPCYCCC